jgi:hypothetical protein
VGQAKVAAKPPLHRWECLQPVAGREARRPRRAPRWRCRKVGHRTFGSPVYDNALRKRTGSYYTPPEVVGATVSLVDDVLRSQGLFDTPTGFASTEVTIADPAVGSVAGFLNGPGFQKMRDDLRRSCHEIWVIDCSPEGHQPDVPTRVFQGVRQPVCIVLAARALRKNSPHHVGTLPHFIHEGQVGVCLFCGP